MALRTLAAPTRTEFGKGAARRTRRAGNIPAVVYGHGADPIHIAINNLGFLAVVREEGINAVISLDIDGEETTALVKSIAQNPLTREIEHVDFLIVKKGEKVEVEVPLVVEGNVASGAIFLIELDVLKVNADALSIPEDITISVEGMEAGSTITAGDVKLPEGVELADDPEQLLVNVTFEEIEDTTPDTGEEEAEAATEEAASEAAESTEE